MKWLKIFSILLGAYWFFPISCTTGVVIGTKLIASIDERFVSKGEALHPLFSVVIEHEDNSKNFHVLRLDELSKLQKNPASFRLSKPVGRANFGSSNIVYHVLEDTGQEQLIEVVETYNDGDKTIWSRYKAFDNKVVPVSSKMFYFGYMFSAFPYGFGFALILFALGRFYRRKVNTVRSKDVIS